MVKERICSGAREKLAINGQQQAIKIKTDTVLSAVHTSEAPAVV